MQATVTTLFEMVLSLGWLTAIGLALAALLAIRMLCYRRLNLACRDELTNSRELIENLSEGIYRSTPDGRILSANPALARLNGCDSTDELLTMVTDIASEWYVDPDRRREFRRLLMRDGHIREFVSEVYRYKTRERIWVSEGARLVRDKKSGRPLYYEGSVHEVTGTVKRLKLEEFYQKLISQVPGGLFQIVRKADGGFSVSFVSPGFLQISGLDQTDHSPSSDLFIDMIHAEDRAGFLSSLYRSGRELERWDCEFKAIDARGNSKWLRVTATPEAIDDGIIWHGYVADISQRKQNEMAIQKLAFNDPLTELPNRRMLEERVGATARRCACKGGHGALLFLDLDNFKELNDSHGHHAGDTFLKLVATRLRSCVTEGDVVARMGGDEFVVLIEDAGREFSEATRRAVVTANRILSALRQTYEIDDLRHSSSASIGIVVFDGSEQSSDEVLKKADIAMYRVKATGRDGMALYDGVPATDGTPRPDLEMDQAENHQLRRLSA
jgi:diguanylate cyclase (GGDEF)-like protein/PAS domain S-box-containing protein